MWKLKKMVQMDLFTRQKWSHRGRKQTWLIVEERREGGEGINWEFLIDIYTLLYIK